MDSLDLPSLKNVYFGCEAFSSSQMIIFQSITICSFLIDLPLLERVEFDTEACFGGNADQFTDESDNDFDSESENDMEMENENEHVIDDEIEIENDNNSENESEHVIDDEIEIENNNSENETNTADLVEDMNNNKKQLPLLILDSFNSLPSSL